MEIFVIVCDNVKVGILPENGATFWPAATKSLEIMLALTLSWPRFVPFLSDLIGWEASLFRRHMDRSRSADYKYRRLAGIRGERLRVCRAEQACVCVRLACSSNLSSVKYVISYIPSGAWEFSQRHPSANMRCGFWRCNLILIHSLSTLKLFFTVQTSPEFRPIRVTPALAFGISLTLFCGARLHSGWPCWWDVLWVELSLVSCFHLSNFCIFTSVWWRYHVEDWGFDTSLIGLCWPEWVSVVSSWLRTLWSIAAAGLSDWCVPVTGHPLREPWLCVGRCSDGLVLCQYRPTWLASCLVGLSPLWALSIPTWPDAAVGLGMTVLYDGPSGRAVSLVQLPSRGTLIHSVSHARFIEHFLCRNVAGTTF